MPSLSSRYATWISCCAVFVFFALLIAIKGDYMLGDSDPFWHIAAGDWMRNHHSIPLSDPWSFTAGDYHWLNIAWAWDWLFSIIHEQLGWHGAEAASALTLALTLAFIYATCLAYCKDGIAAFLTTVGVITILNVNLRPLQVTQLMVAIWVFILSGVARGEYAKRWLAALPYTLVLWVNMHGGFVAGATLIVAFLAQALWQRDYPLARALFYTGFACLFALCINPYGWNILEAAWRPLYYDSSSFIIEWEPFNFSSHNLLRNAYGVLFCFLVLRRRLPVQPAQRWLAYGWLFLGLLSIRHLAIFAVISGPLLACRLQELLAPRHAPTARAIAIRHTILNICSHRITAIAAFACCIGISIWLPGAQAAHVYAQQDVPHPSLKAEIAFLKTHYPDIRLLNYYDLGGYLIYEGRGAVAPFVDGRSETAYPPEVMADYIHFHMAHAGWEGILDKYKIGAVMLPNDNSAFLDRFVERQGWNAVFKGPFATIFIRTKNRPNMPEASP